MILIITQDFDGSLAAYDEIRRLGAETSAHHHCRDLALEQLNRHQEALESYQKSLDSSSGADPAADCRLRQHMDVLRAAIHKHVADIEEPAIPPPSRYSNADLEQARNIEYVQSLQAWRGLPWWKRLWTARPRNPSGLD